VGTPANPKARTQHSGRENKKHPHAARNHRSERVPGDRGRKGGDRRSARGRPRGAAPDRRGRRPSRPRRLPLPLPSPPPSPSPLTRGGQEETSGGGNPRAARAPARWGSRRGRVIWGVVRGGRAVGRTTPKKRGAGFVRRRRRAICSRGLLHCRYFNTGPFDLDL
jgi:hypothetical protein